MDKRKEANKMDLILSETEVETILTEYVKDFYSLKDGSITKIFRTHGNIVFEIKEVKQ